MTAKDLLIKLLDYQYRWSHPHTINSKPAKIRRQQIEALQAAFGIAKANVNPLVQITYAIVGSKEKSDRAKQLNSLTSIEYLTSGEFLLERPLEGNKELSERVTALISSLSPPVPGNLAPSQEGIKYLFSHLLGFRQDVYKVASPGPKISEGFSAGLSYSHHLQDKLKEVINIHLNEIDDTLCLILDPEKRVIDKKVLVEKYGYPDVNLANVDLEWRAITEESEDS